MTSMKDREQGFERKFVMDEEVRFKATARRNKLLGLWAAEKLGKSGADAEAYAREVVVSDVEEAGDHDVFRKVRKDFDAAGVDQSDHQLRRTMDELMHRSGRADPQRLIPVASLDQSDRPPAGRFFFAFIAASGPWWPRCKHDPKKRLQAFGTRSCLKTIS